VDWIELVGSDSERNSNAVTSRSLPRATQEGKVHPRTSYRFSGSGKGAPRKPHNHGVRPRRRHGRNRARGNARQLHRQGVANRPRRSLPFGYGRVHG
jgi:hypothetical protein